MDFSIQFQLKTPISTQKCMNFFETSGMRSVTFMDNAVCYFAWQTGLSTRTLKSIVMTIAIVTHLAARIHLPSFIFHFIFSALSQFLRSTCDYKISVGRSEFPFLSNHSNWKITWIPDYFLQLSNCDLHLDLVTGLHSRLNAKFEITSSTKMSSNQWISRNLCLSSRRLRTAISLSSHQPKVIISHAKPHTNHLFFWLVV